MIALAVYALAVRYDCLDSSVCRHMLRGNYTLEVLSITCVVINVYLMMWYAMHMRTKCS
jgi:hypothetical protein